MESYDDLHPTSTTYRNVPSKDTMAHETARAGEYLHLAVHDAVKLLDDLVDLPDAIRALRGHYPKLSTRAFQKKFKLLLGVSAKSYLSNARRVYVRETLRQWGDGPEARQKISNRLGVTRSAVNSIVSRAGLSKVCDRQITYRLGELTQDEQDDTMIDARGRIRERTDILKELYRG